MSFGGLNTARFFVQGRWVLSNFWHLTFVITFAIFLEKFLEAWQWSLKTRQKSYPQGHSLQRNGPLKNWKICPFWRVLFQKWKKAEISNFKNFWFRFYGSRKTLFFYFLFFHFGDFLTTFCQRSYEKTIRFHNEHQKLL